MRKFAKTLLLLMMAAMLIGSLALSVCASEYTDPEAAQAYLDSYADNVGTDENFDENINTALETVRQDVSGYATFLSLLNQRRIKHVCRCLEEGRSVEEAATQSVFSSPLYMARVFHQLMGCTPHIHQRTVQQPHDPL